MEEAESEGMLWEAALGSIAGSGADVLLLAKTSVQPLRPGRTPCSAPSPAQQIDIKYELQS